MLAATALLAVALGLGTWTSRPRPAGPAAPAWILVSEFENHTGDARLAGVLQFAFEQELAQSRALTVVPRERIDDTLRLMKRPAGTRIDSTLAREVAIRDGEISRVAAGRIDQVGQNYSLSVTIRDARSSRSVAGAAVEAPTLDAVLAGVKTVAGRVRAIVGDDPLRLEADGKLEKVTTGSLEALHAYTRGMAFVNERRWEPAELALRDATRLDPAFASAYIMLAHSARNIGRPKDDWLPLARRAMDLSESLPDRERYFIAGSYYGMAGDRRNAVAAYEVLVREHPDDYWGVNNLAGQYDAMGRYSEALAMKLRQARLRPHDFDLNVDAAMNLVGSRSLAEARPFVDRSLSIVPADPQTRVSPRTEINLAWLDTLPVFELWTQGRAREAADRLDRIASRQAFGGRLAQFVGTWNLALGRLRAAEQAFRSLPLEFDRQEFLAFSALARDDKGGVQRVLEDDPRLADPNPAEFQPRLMAVWALVYAGAVDRAAELARHSGTVDDGNAGYAMLWSQIVAARGEADAALSLVRRVPTPVMSNPPALRALAAEAELLAAGHDLDAAAARLRITDSTRGVHLFNGSSGYWWLRARVRLMDVERLLGNASRARAIQEELRQLLAVADPDFVLLRDLN
jgi:tetratricopeptide (TPR) repeat protein